MKGRIGQVLPDQLLQELVGMYRFHGQDGGALLADLGIRLNRYLVLLLIFKVIEGTSCLLKS